jgi:hypothetical protein
VPKATQLYIAVLLVSIPLLGQTLDETFNHAPDYTNNWHVGYNNGSTSLTYTSGNMLFHASSSGSSIALLSDLTFSGDVDVSFELNHQGFGQTKVGLFGTSGLNPLVFFDLDTDDVACLWMNVPGSPVQSVCPSSPYMNRWLTLRIKLQGSRVSFYADGGLLATIPYNSPAGSYVVGFGAASVPWKSGDNNTSFRHITAQGNVAGGWTKLPSSAAPGARLQSAMAFDPARNQIVLFGGNLFHTIGQTNDTWVWDGATWTQKFPNAQMPRTQGHVLATNVNGNGVIYLAVTLGGSGSGTFRIWDGTNWTQGNLPNQLFGLQRFSVTYDPSRNQVVLFGGYGCNAPPPFCTASVLKTDTWVWDGATWTQKFPSVHPPGGDVGMAYDTTRREVVLFAGSSGSPNTWVWNGATWTQKFPLTSPPPRIFQNMASDSIRSEVLLFGGFNPSQSQFLSDTWTWDGNNWTQPILSGPQPGWSYDSMEYDATRGQVVLLDEGDTWLWGPSQPTSGTIQVTTNLPGATFTITGPATYNGSGTSFTQANAPAGVYTITYGNVAGSITPPTQISTLATGNSISFNGVYSPSNQLGGAGTISQAGFSSEPVNTSTGNYVTSHTDLLVAGKGLSFIFTRYYNSLDTYSGPLGAGWTDSYNLILKQVGGQVVIKEGDGHEDVFNAMGSGNYSPQTPGLFDSWKMNADSSFTLTRKNQTKVNFSRLGQLQSIVDRNGNAQTLVYSGGNLVTITDSSAGPTA